MGDGVLLATGAAGGATLVGTAPPFCCCLAIFDACSNSAYVCGFAENSEVAKFVEVLLVDVKDKTDVTAASSNNLKADAITLVDKSFIDNVGQLKLCTRWIIVRG